MFECASDGIIFLLSQMYSSQFPDELYDVTRNIVKFNAQCDPLIKIHFPEERLDGGWLLELKSPANEVLKLFFVLSDFVCSLHRKLYVPTGGT